MQIMEYINKVEESVSAEKCSYGNCPKRATVTAYEGDEPLWCKEHAEAVEGSGELMQDE